MKNIIPISFLALILALVPFLGCNNVHGSKSYQYRNGQISSTRDIYSDSILKYVKYNYPTLALMHANVVDGTGTVLKEDQTIVIKHGLFEAIGGHTEIEVPRNAKILDLKGKTIIPGIVGMHNHLHIPGFPNVGNMAAKLYLASGVTTIQTCGAALPYKELELSKEIEKGNQIGPDIIPSAPFITGKDGNPNMVIPRDDKHLKDTVQHWIDQGVTWFKVYRNTTPKDLKTIIDVAHGSKAKVRGHLCATTFEEAAQLGIDGIEHGLNSTSDFRMNKEYGICGGGREYMDELIVESPKVKALQQLMIDKEVFLTSTLSIYEASIPNRAYADKRTLKTMSPFLLNQYEERRENLDKNIKDTTRNNRLKRIMQFEYQYFKMGGLLCSGVDAGRHVLPGFGDQRNYELLIEAGFSTPEAVQIMTGNGAKALQRFDIGTIQEGKRANFVILNGNLEKDPAIIEKVETVFKNGIGYDSHSILETIEGQFAKE
ncbi:MAG: amidohydrolase family protein [Muricauda sp.]|nr:amidohydrolase family protein [Allomuricauda sp.]MBA4745669.1 amidohydrolase family protein [Allomuricauda sp.]